MHKEKEEVAAAAEPEGASLDAMPAKKEELSDLERSVFDALIAATHVRAEAIGESWVWNIAQSRSLCEMVRRVPTTMDELRMCWGFGGGGVRAARHGDFLLDALRPYVARLKAVHDAEHAALAATANDVGAGGGTRRRYRRRAEARHR